MQILFDTIVTDVIMKGRNCKGLLIQNKSGRSYCTAKVYVDATGDADLLFRAGVPTVQGKNYFTYIGYGYNFMVLDPKWNAEHNQTKVKHSRCVAPSRQFVLLETRGKLQYTYGYFSSNSDTNAAPNHDKKGMNILYDDNHVEKFIVADPFNVYGETWTSKAPPAGYLGQCSAPTTYLNTGWCQFK